jgi:hypothetical protein
VAEVLSVACVPLEAQKLSLKAGGCSQELAALQLDPPPQNGDNIQ